MVGKVVTEKGAVLYTGNEAGDESAIGPVKPVNIGA